MRPVRALGLAGAALLLAACSTAPQKSPPPSTASRVEPAKPSHTGPRHSPYAPAQEDPSKRGNYTRGGLYAPGIQDSVPDSAIADVDQIPEPDVVDLPHSAYGNRSPYNVLGKTYKVLPDAHGYDEIGNASYYGQKFHGRRTSNLEVYDMYAFTAAHRTLPLPSFARVTNLANGKSVIVRINDRGPFHDGRLIDLSYAAAVKLGVYPHGTARVQVHGLTAADMVDGDQRVATNGAPMTTHGVETGVDASATPIALAGGPSADPDAAASSSSQADAKPQTPAPKKGDKDWRFDMRQDGRTMSADEFDAWMRARQARVATGKPQPAPNVEASKAVAPAPVPAVMTPRAVAATPAPAPDAVTLQVASFAARANAERALAMVTGAGIGNARLLDADANGRKVWRLRVGPIDPDAAAELGQRLQGLGFGQPQRVRE
jgi:rare lipoprotein A